ncbi:DUF3348 domain-containing protein [Pseudomaricurvus alkylphenolicus]|jgi:hypothetical protein|uniref:DUF3348 family protein n=1 Tax=Pseudomaricurvus alkylphenolicus TaxID=1306991 RepID=UPI00141F0FEB|nr:DUF3348 family protein [Pseudomaricurvus alkylphenolicus]NIB42986.1 DUF3348 domain-containing protein [Pseudomaricurvus alkylphenolicus]
MTQFQSQISLHGSRLVRYLSDLAVSDVQPSHKDFALRLGQMFDFSDSIKLSRVHGGLKRLKFEPLDITADAIKREFLQVRQAAVKAILKSFEPDAAGVKYRFPVAKEPQAGNESQGSPGFEVYQRFYLGHQRELESRVQFLQSFVRDGAMGLSPRLAKLVELELALGETVAQQGRRFFGVIPKLLERRFHFLWLEYQQQQHQQPLFEGEDARRPITWLEQFRREMQGLLLAELEARLQPVLGLVEAIDEDAVQDIKRSKHD